MQLIVKAIICVMKLRIIGGLYCIGISMIANGQQEELSRTKAADDSLDNERLAKMVSLSEVIIRSDLNVARFMDQVKKDTTFYKAFRNLHLLGFTAWNDIRIRDKKGKIKASLQSKT